MCVRGGGAEYSVRIQCKNMINAQAGAESTRAMAHATHGRTAYIQHDVHALDPGAVAVATMLQALAQA